MGPWREAECGGSEKATDVWGAGGGDGRRTRRAGQRAEVVLAGRGLTSSLRGLGPGSATAHLCSPFLTLASSILSEGLNGATGAVDRAELSGKSARMWQPASSAEHLPRRGRRGGGAKGRGFEPVRSSQATLAPSHKPPLPMRAPP